MSTKPIREALERLQCTCRDHSCVGCRATAEVDAIERAARAMVHPQLLDLNELKTAVDVLESIAKDAP